MKISFNKLVGVATIIGTGYAALAFYAPTTPSANVTGNSNITIQESRDVVIKNIVVYSTQKPSEIGPLNIQNESFSSLKKGHEVKFFSVTSPLPSYNLARINAFIKNRTLEIYQKNEKFEEVAINVIPEFIGYGLLGVNVEIEVASPNGKVKIDRNVEPDTAAFLAYMSYAHSLQKADGFVLNLDTSEPFEFKDLFRSNYKMGINAIVIAKLKASNSYFKCTSRDDFEKTLGTKWPLNDKQIEKYLGYSFANCFSTVQDNSLFYLNQKGIVLHYSRYEIGPGVLGAVEVLLPYGSIINFVNPNGPLAFLNK